MIKNKNVSIKKISILIISLTIIIITILNIDNIKNFYLSKTTGYNIETIEAFIENNPYDNIKNYKYSKTLENILNTRYYNPKHLKEYVNITYIENENFFKNTSLLLDKGYSSTDINNIYSKLTEESINILIENDYIKDIINMISINYFKEDKLERYIKYYKKGGLDVESIIIYVNIGLDKDYYIDAINIENQEDIDVLVNKYNKLQEDYIPKDLIEVSKKFGNILLKKEAAIAFNNMCNNALKENINIYGGSGYRSYEYQKNLYNKYVKQDGLEIAETYSARPGYSEHQTGLAIDIMNKNWQYINETDKEFNWLKDNSYKYGFILRYPKDKENITGYIYEPWHFRYIETNLATEITRQNITYEEYVAKNSWQNSYVIIKLYT